MRFFIKQYSTLPQLRMEIVNDGRGDFRKYFDSIQNADIYFTMTNVDTSVIKISNAPCYIKEKEDGGCSEEYVICYDWQKRDTKEKGTYEYINGTIHYTVQYDSLLNYQTQQFIGYNKKHYYSADGNNTSDKANYTEKAMFSVQKEGKRQWVSKDTYLQQLTDKELDLYFSMDVYKAK